MQKRNKYLSSSSENAEAVSKLLNGLEGAKLNGQAICGILADCAEQLLKQRFAEEECCSCQWLIEGLGQSDYVSENVQFSYIAQEDLLGFLYLSLRALKERKKSGSYYTPKKVAERLIEGLMPERERETVAKSEERCRQTVTVLDPACGTGSILLELPDTCQLQQIYGYDIDPVAIAIVRINMALKYWICDKDVLTEHFQVRDFLKEGSHKAVDVILGNPPWGADLVQAEKHAYAEMYRTAGQKSVESGDLFVEQGLNVLQPGGQMCFVLPEALLHVKTHRMVRSLILEQSSIKRVEYLGEVFEKVQCPSVILTLEKRIQNESEITKEGTERQARRLESSGDSIDIITENRRFTIFADGRCCEQRKEAKDYQPNGNNEITRLSEEGFLLDATEEEFALLQKLSAAKNTITLKGQAEFALGIVTGNNAKHLLMKKEEGSEPILRGSDIERFRVKGATSYIHFCPEQYQQVAPVELYRAPEKLLYRFVGERPVFAYDDRQTLTLNSCNIVIPRVEGMDMRYIMAVFNSSVIEFWHKRVNHSMKLLRAHIEAFPIPAATQERQQEMIRYVELLQENEREMLEQQAQSVDVQSEMIGNELCVVREKICTRLDWKIAELFGLTDAEYALVKKACE